MIFCMLPGCTNPEPTVGNSDVCDRCRERLHDRLRWIEFFVANLTPVKAVRPGMVATAAGFESASPAFDDAIVMLDPRSSAVGVGRSLTGPDDDEHPPLSAPAVLGGWARQVWEARTPRSLRHLIPPPRNVGHAVSTLLAALGWICEQRWVGDFAEEIGDLYRQLAAATGETPPRPVATCIRREGDPPGDGGLDDRPVCGGGIVARQHTAEDAEGPVMVGARCLSCGASYTGFDLLRLGRRMRVAEAGPPAPGELLPWYERGPDGVPTGRQWADEKTARDRVGDGCTVHRDVYAADGGSTSFGVTRHTRPAASGPADPWRPATLREGR
ncbi:hypothetical protein ACWEFJ_28350 [Actinosynnema sp. NPDC004786]